MSKTIIRYSESFKLKVVTELEEGKFDNGSQAAKFYNIKGTQTVKLWLQKYGKNHLISKVVRVETCDEKSRIKELELEIKRLKETVVDLSCREVYSRATLQVVCEDYGIDLENVKKNSDAGGSLGQKK